MSKQVDLLGAESIIACERCGASAGSLRYGRELPRGLCGRCYADERRRGTLQRWALRRRRSPYCKNGHALTADNTIVTYPKSRRNCKRECLKCKRARRNARWDSPEYRALYRHHMKPELYTALLLSQGGACAVCKAAPANGERLHIDHDHACCPQPGLSCGRCVRGLLCRHCNAALGHVGDSTERLLALSRYLDRCRDPLIEVLR